MCLISEYHLIRLKSSFSSNCSKGSLHSHSSLPLISGKYAGFSAACYRPCNCVLSKRMSCYQQSSCHELSDFQTWKRNAVHSKCSRQFHHAHLPAADSTKGTVLKIVKDQLRSNLIAWAWSMLPPPLFIVSLKGSSFCRSSTIVQLQDSQRNIYRHIHY